MAHNTIALFRLVRSRQIINLIFPGLSFPSTGTKLLIQGGAWWTGFETSTCNVLSISFLNDSFKMLWDWSTGGLLGCDTSIDLDMLWVMRNASNIITNIWISIRNVILACNKLWYYTFVVRHCRFFSGNVYTDFGLSSLDGQHYW